MFQNPIVDRFVVTGPDGRIVALVADGPSVPEWPADLSAVEDAQLPELERAYLAEFERLAALADDDPEAAASEEAMVGLAEHVTALRDEAARRMAVEPGEGDGEGDEGGEGGTTTTTTTETETETGNDGAAADRTARIAALRAGLTPPPAPLPDPGVSREDLVAAVQVVAETAAATTAAAVGQAVQAALAASAPAQVAVVQGRRATAADLGQFRPDALAPNADGGALTPRIDARLIATADNQNVPMGAEFTELSQLVDAFKTRLESIGSSTGVSDEKVPIATLSCDIPDERDLRGMDWTMARAKVREVIGEFPQNVDAGTVHEALTASGGLDQPVAPYYPQLVVATAARPVRDALPTFAADRGGIILVLPPSIGSITGVATPGAFADGVTNTDTSLVSATAAFVASDVGSVVSGAGIPANTVIASVTNGTTVVLSAATTATATGVTFRIVARNPNNLGAPVGLQSVAQDAAGGPVNVKYTFDVPLGTRAEFDVYSVYTSLQFANLTARTSPERVEAYIRLADALHARVAETQMLDVITAWSTKFTGAKTFGTARQLLAQWGHMAAFYRNSERMAADAPLRIGIPAWAIQAMRADYLSTFIGGGAANWGLSDAEIVGFFVEHNLNPFFYLDGPSDVSQLFATSALAAATNTGANTATATPIPDFPGSGATTSFRNKVVSFMWAEGTWLGLTTGELNLGLVRDSILNSQNKFRNFMEEWETPAFVGTRSLRCVHTVASDGTYGAAASVTLGVGSGL